MRKYNALYFLLFILLVMGAFASMAQNSYGLKIMGGVAWAFGLIFLAEMITIWRRKVKMDPFVFGELTALFIFAIIFGCRIFYIHFPYIEWLFAAAGAFLVFFYARKLFIRCRRLYKRNLRLALLGLIFHLSIVFFLVSLVLIPFAGKKSEWSGMAGFALLLIFMLGALIKRNDLVEGEKTTAVQMVTGYRDHSIILASIFLLFSLYAISSRAGLLPPIYSDEYPQSYFDLVNKASTGKEKSVDGKYQYQRYMEKYNQFLKRNKKGTP
ncbi:MAG TPA: hypothetical protein VLJ68_02570 [Chitinophagaceae bacterium]|nr:hypothetical protein [Chitinophagaceae bacterium]